MRQSYIVGVFLMMFSAVALAAAPKAAVSVSLSGSSFAPGDRGAIAVAVDVPAGLHAQSHTPLEDSLIPLVVKLKSNPALTPDDAVYPSPTIEEYPVLGKVSVYTGRVLIYVPFTVQAGAAGVVKVSGSVSLQLCDDATCFIPDNVPFSFDLSVGASQATSNLKTDDFPKFDATLLTARSTTAPTTTSTTIQPAKAAPSPETAGPQSLVGAVLLALGVGVIFNFVPCVLPVLPLKAMGFYEAAEHDRKRTILFGLAFSAGMTLLFTALALLVVLSKSIFGKQIQWGEQFAHAAFVWPMAIVLLLLGVSMMGLFTVKLPTSVYGLAFRHDTLTGNALWGGLTAILATPCTAPLFPPLITYAIAQPPLIAFITMTAVGVGMSLPYLILSAFPQLARKFPRTGPFAELFKQMMAFLLIGTAAWLAGIRLLPDPKHWWLVFAVVVVAAIFLVVRTGQIARSNQALVVSLVLAFLMITGGLVAAQRLTYSPFKWQPFTPQALALARDKKQIVLVEFTASWCLNCKYIEQTVYHNPATIARLEKEGVIALKADLTDSSAPGWALLNELGGTGIPFTAIYSPSIEKPITLESIYTSDTLLKTLEKAK